MVSLAEASLLEAEGHGTVDELAAHNGFLSGRSADPVARLKRLVCHDGLLHDNLLRAFKMARHSDFKEDDSVKITCGTHTRQLECIDKSMSYTK